MVRVAPQTGQQAEPEPVTQKGGVLAKDLDMVLNTEAVRELWNFYQVSPNFFGTLNFAQDGGYSEVPALFDSSRFLWASITLISLGLNIYALLVPNLRIFTREDMAWSMPVIEDSHTGYSKLIITRSLSQFVEEGHIVVPQIVLALLELSLLAWYLFRTFYALSGIAYVREHPSSRWHMSAHLFWDLVPELSTFSAMKLLNYVTPAIVIPALTATIQRTRIRIAKGRRLYQICWPLLRFVVFRGLCAIIGFEAFMIKLVTTSRDFAMTDRWTALVMALIFINQMLGVVQVRRFAQHRLFIFIFGGEDGFMTDRELNIARTWLAMLAQKMWQVARTKSPFPTLWFLAVALAYGDNDFQMLTLNERTLKKQAGEQPDGRKSPQDLEADATAKIAEAKDGVQQLDQGGACGERS